mmetsp:Transcript_14074/g.20800  ORF Transcript_14074/g.20800 Transcript_14074/m.20800 type:complete len:166 (-) Transcript_14074:767-1264(-)
MTRFCVHILLFLSHLLSTTEVHAGAIGECLPVGEDLSQFYCSNQASDLIPCNDEHENCKSWAEKGECRNNPTYMSYNCRKACESCVSLHHGSMQHCPEERDLPDMIRLLIETQQYIYDRFSVKASMYRSCENKDPLCAKYALQGECKKNPSFMHKECPAVCKVCK